MTDTTAPVDGASPLERERDYYLKQTDDLGAQVLRLQAELNVSRKETRRNRVTSVVVRELFEFASNGHDFDEVASNMTAILVAHLGCEAAAVLQWQGPPEQGAYVVSHGRGVANGTAVTIAGGPERYTCDSFGPALACEEIGAAVSAGTDLRQWIWSSRASPAIALLVGDGESPRGMRPDFEASDRETLEAALGALVSVADLKKVEDALRTSEENYRTIFASVNDAILVIDGTHGSIRTCNAMALSLLDYQEGDLVGHYMTELLDIPELHLERVSAKLRAALDGVPQLFETRGRRRDGESFEAEVNLATAAVDDERHVILLMRDISARVRAERALRHAALHDALTGLPNRTLLLERLAQASRREQREPTMRHALLYLDLDRFKMVNDSLGHAIGDQLLVAVGQRLRELTRPTDTVTRLGGDEFVILIEEVPDYEHALRAARRVNEALERPFEVGSAELMGRASIGIVLSCDSSGGPEEMLRNADIAMYRAKGDPADNVAIFNPAMHKVAMDRMQLERDLRSAIDHDEIHLAFQPVMRLSDRRIAGYEALVRWEHPLRGKVMPGEFIDYAEETGLVIPLGQLVLDLACRQLAQWERRYPEGFPLFISINLSGKQLERQSFAQELHESIRVSGCDPRHLAFEITETALMVNAEAAAATLQSVRDLGSRVYMDDFGTGYSSLSYLHQFPIDVLKIDRSFVLGMDGSEDGKRIVETIVSLGKSLDKRVVAEGVETIDHVRMLQTAGCDYGQGFYYSRPVSPERAEQLLETGAGATVLLEIS